MHSISKTVNTIAIIFKILAGILFLTGCGEILIDQLLKALVKGFPTSEMYGDSWLLKLLLQNFTLIAVLQIFTAALLYLNCRGFLRQESWSLRGLRFFAYLFLGLNITAGICFISQVIPDTLGASADTFKAFIGFSAGLFCLLFLVLIRYLKSPAIREAFGEVEIYPGHPAEVKGLHKSN